MFVSGWDGYFNPLAAGGHDGAVDRHELPQPVAAPFADQLRALGVGITWRR